LPKAFEFPTEDTLLGRLSESKYQPMVYSLMVLSANSREPGLLSKGKLMNNFEPAALALDYDGNLIVVEFGTDPSRPTLHGPPT